MTALPTLKQLRHLVALDEHRHFRRAAESCHVTQSSLSASLRELEGLLGVALVERSQRRVAMTPAGEACVRRARRLLADAHTLVDAARAVGRPLTGPLRLGAIPTIGPFLLPPAFAPLALRFPDLKLEVREGLTAELLRDMEAGSLDAALLAWPIDEAGLDSAALFRDELVLACPAGHPLARQAEITADDLDGTAPLLLRDGHCLRDHALAACPPSAARRGSFEATGLYTLVRMVAAGQGVTLLPQLAVAAGLADDDAIALVPFADPTPAREVRLAWRPESARADDFRRLAAALADLAPLRPAPTAAA